MLNVNMVKLPTRSPNRHSGKYPTRVATVSSSKGVTHLETWNGERYVLLTADVVRDNPYARLGDFIGCDVETADYRQMSVAEYAGVLFVIQLLRELRHA